MIQLTIEYFILGTSIEIDLQDDGYTVLDGYYPDSPSDFTKPIRETIRVEIIGTSPADLSSKMGAINLAFEHARNHKVGPLGCYVNFAVDAGSDIYRSRLTDGITVLDPGLTRRWRQNRVVLSVVIERQPWWEGEEVAVPLTNSSATAETDGIQVGNAWNGTTENFVSIDETDVIGDLPGATRLEITNNFNTDNNARLYDVWIGQNWSTPTSLTPQLEGEDSSVGHTGSWSFDSGESYIYETVPGSGEVTLAKWALDAAFLAGCAGNFFKVLVRFSDHLPPDFNVRYKLVITYFDVTVLWESYWITLDSNRWTLIRDLFQLRLPPWLPNQTGLGPVELLLKATQDTGQPFVVGGPNVDIGVDFIYLMPTEGWRYLTCIGYGVPEDSRMIDDGINGEVWSDNGLDEKIGIIAPSGAPIMLKPGTTQRLYFLMHSWYANTAEVDRTISVKLFYRPRRVNV